MCRWCAGWRRQAPGRWRGFQGRAWETRRDPQRASASSGGRTRPSSRLDVHGRGPGPGEVSFISEDEEAVLLSSAKASTARWTVLSDRRLRDCGCLPAVPVGRASINRCVSTHTAPGCHGPRCFRPCGSESPFPSCSRYSGCAQRRAACAALGEEKWTSVSQRKLRGETVLIARAQPKRAGVRDASTYSICRAPRWRQAWANLSIGRVRDHHSRWDANESPRLPPFAEKR